MILFMLGCYLSPSQPNVCHATRPSPSPTVRIAILSISRGEICRIGAALAEEPECPVNPQSDPMSITCNERNRTAPPSGRSESIAQTRFRDKRYCCIFILRRSSGISPGRWSNISPELQLIAYCGVFPPRGRDFRDPPVHLIVVSLLG